MHRGAASEATGPPRAAGAGGRADASTSSGSAPLDDAEAAESAALQERYASIPGMARFAELLSTTGVERGLIGPREVARLWPRHLANCAVVAEQVTPQLPLGARVADVGSGAGLPGLVWALVREDLDVTLIEPLLRRATFLNEVVAELTLSTRVHVLRQRAEAVEDRFDAVTARAVARLPQLAQWTLPLTAPGGWVIALKGSNAEQEIAEAAAVIASLGGGPAQAQPFGSGVLMEPTTAVLIPRVSEGGTPAARRRMGGRQPGHVERMR